MWLYMNHKNLLLSLFRESFLRMQGAQADSARVVSAGYRAALVLEYLDSILFAAAVYRTLAYIHQHEVLHIRGDFPSPHVQVSTHRR